LFRACGNADSPWTFLRWDSGAVRNLTSKHLAVLKADGIDATVMPLGVLFRGGEEGKIRQRIIDDDLLDTVIGHGPQLAAGWACP
jgi:type I restriction-modification system DNA methylase subunit